MKLKIVISLFSLLLMLGCSSIPDNHATNSEVIQKHQPTSDSHISEYLSSVNKPVAVGNWQITMKPKEIDPHTEDFVDYNFDCRYLGNSKVTNAKITVGNGISELKDISYGEGASISSSFAKDTKQIEFSITTSQENGETYTQTHVFMTGQ